MTDIINSGSGRVLVAAPAAPRAVVYLIAPPQIVAPGWLEAQAALRGIAIAVPLDYDWDNDLSPWPAVNVPASQPPFAGHAAEFLNRLTTRIFPAVEQHIGLDASPASRTLSGVSMGGLFSVWAKLRGALPADNIGSISGSFWFDDFLEWAAERFISPGWRAYLSLGDKEGLPSDNPRFRSVRHNTLKLETLLQGKGVDSVFQSNPGNHFAPLSPRLLKMLDWLFA